MQPFDALFEHASSRVEGLEANQALWDVRRELETDYANVICYEMVLGDQSWNGFLEQQIPRLTEHLISKGLPLLGGPNVVLSVWQGSHMFMFRCAEFFQAIRDIEHLSPEELRGRIGDWRVGVGLPRHPHGKHAPLPRVAGKEPDDLPAPRGLAAPMIPLPPSDDGETKH
jgi:hypothetical protein